MKLMATPLTRLKRPNASAFLRPTVRLYDGFTSWACSLSHCATFSGSSSSFITSEKHSEGISSLLAGIIWPITVAAAGAFILAMQMAEEV